MSKKDKIKKPHNDKSPVVPQGGKVKEPFPIREPEWTPRQKELINVILDKNTKIILINGVAGTGKTHLAVYCGLRMLKEKRVSRINYIRSAVESSSKSVGFLPGEADDKIAPYARPLMDKMDEFIDAGTTNKLINDGYVSADLVNFLRGASINVEYLLLDEAQNLDRKELVTVLTRFGKFSKFIFCGDKNQSDINGRSGFPYLLELFDDQESRDNGIYVFNLTKEDIVRSEELKFIIDKLEKGLPAKE